MIPATPRSRGFTLVELLCSMAIGSIILLVAAFLLGSSGDGYERVGGGVAAESEARAAVSQLTADLSTAMFHKDGIIEESSAIWPSDRIGFLSLQPSQAQTDSKRIGDLCAVNYYLADLTINGKKVRCLMRGFRESGDTFTALKNSAAPGLFAALEKIDEPVAFGVVSFEARPMTRDAGGKWIDWVPGEVTGPLALDTRLVLARRSLFARLTRPGDWDASGLLGNPAAAASNKDLEIYGAMIPFGNHENP